jgi:hypothetical protein
MADIASLLPQILVYGLLLFAAFILVYKVRNFLNGKTGCDGCLGGCGSSSGESACCRTKSADSDSNNGSKLNVIERNQK